VRFARAEQLWKLSLEFLSATGADSEIVAEW